jgi:diguanylate cyclase (GGDEF)-like protein
VYSTEGAVNPLRTAKRLAVLLLLTAGYFVACKLGLKLAYLHASATAVWPGTGIALAAFLVLGYRVWPGILLGAFLVNSLTAGTVATSLGIATGNTLEGLLGCYLLRKYARGENTFDTARDVFKFAALAGMVCTIVSATFGAASLYLGGFAKAGLVGPIWSTWWLGDAVGAVLVAPFLLLWIGEPRLRWNWRQLLELAIFLAALSAVGWLVFGGRFQLELGHYPLEFLCIPFLVWAAFRFGPRETATATLLLAGIASWGTLHGFGPFVVETHNSSLMLVQSFAGVTGVMCLAVAAEVSEHKRAEEKVRALAVSDPLTGLGNYRRLLEAIDAEIKRSERTGRTFALLLLDLDGLKKINDGYGHLVGSRALCRLGDALRVHSRETDTAARYGGDEFALVLPEIGAQAAQQVANRIRARLARDGEDPPISVSVGVAVCPEDGQTIRDLLNRADHALYDQKSQRRLATSQSVSIS